MTEIYDPLKQTTFYATNVYPSGNKEARAMTIAAFRVAQNNSEVDGREMNRELLYFLLASSHTAIDYWRKNNRLHVGDKTIRLEKDGIDECFKSLSGLTRGYNVSESDVTDWVYRMLKGDHVATECYFLNKKLNANKEPESNLIENPIDDNVYQQIKSRRGQSKFRQNLLVAFNEKCCISKNEVLAVLEAAHIIPHTQETNYSISNGLLLRADIHTLYDLNLIGIDKNGTVHISHSLKASEYSQYDGTSIGHELPQVMSDNLKQRYELFNR
ncbi:HNH endonuclease [Colwellia chukchiensis]|uniref:HNH endonuclease n=1 Tax=Colwellia chukchiensis TaxID=641665 RepID=A0A1H7Q1N6_9GAMM|nr:HNH endonuclease [Colwellia chukchiensis]SEL42000.1 HNH endonuclease [Colwellia chukchiensis]